MALRTQEQEDAAKKRTANVRAYADIVYPQVLSTMLHASKEKLQSEKRVEEQRALRIAICRTAADISITAGDEFIKKWSERKGAFLAG